MRTAPKVSPVTTERCSPFLLLHAPQAHPAAGTKDAEMRGMSLGFLFASPRRVGGCREIEERRGAEERPGSPRALRTFGGSRGGPGSPRALRTFRGYGGPFEAPHLSSRASGPESA